MPSWSTAQAQQRVNIPCTGVMNCYDATLYTALQTIAQLV